MEDPKHLGVDLKEVYEVQEPLPPPKIIGYVSRVLGDDSKYDADGNEIVEAKPAPLEKVPDEPLPPPVPEQPVVVEDPDDESHATRSRGRR